MIWLNLLKTIILIVLINYVLCQNEEKPTEKCVIKQNCFLPKCMCETTKAPVDLSHYRRDEIPQLVILTIDDDQLDVQSYKVYKKLFENMKNPNNKSIKATLFLSDSYNKTSFCLVRNLYEQMHEIAISTVNYTCPHKLCNVAGPSFVPWKYDTWIDEILNMRERLNMYAGIPKSDIFGFRAPLLEPTADMHYKIIAGNKFLYDSSLVVNTNKQASMLWPFTLDYKMTSITSNNGPIDTYKGLWELPLPLLIGYDNKPLTCLKVWESWCDIDKSVRGISKFFRSHFLRAYYNNRAPVVLHLNAAWLKDYVEVTETDILPNFGLGDLKKRKVTHQRKEYRNLDGLIRFMNITLENNKDVYFVTARQAIEWVKLMPTLERKYVNLTKFIDERLFESTGDVDKLNTKKIKYDGSCDYLKQSKPDYTTDSLSKEDFFLDDTYGINQKEQKKPKLNTTILIDLQSEVLFLNDVVIYMVIALAFACIGIIIYDQTSKK